MPVHLLNASCLTRAVMMERIGAQPVPFDEKIVRAVRIQHGAPSKMKGATTGKTKGGKPLPATYLVQ